MKRRQPILLLELLISLLLMGIVVETLFLGYRQAAVSRQQLYEEKEVVLERQRLLLRLSAVFQTIQSCQQVAEGWFFSYDGGIDHEARFRGPLDALLCIKNGRLLLISWAKDRVSRVETLYEHPQCKTLSFDFFDSKSGSFKSIFPESKPCMMKLKIDSLFELPFFL